LEPVDTYYNQWLDHYPKAPWIFGAVIYNLTGNIETGKVMHFMLMLAVFLSTYSFISSIPLHPWLCLLISGLLAVNPVSLSQSLSYYIDGLVSSLFILL
jgi:hypothetical protein